MPQQHYRDIEYQLSAGTIQQLPAENACEIAFAGRSNVGKSSVLNALCQNKNLAKTSKTPGRTQCINFFQLDAGRFIVDLPGYGYAKVPQQQQKNWQRLLSHYLESRDCLRGLVLIMDIRHPMTKLDQQLLGWAEHAELPLHIILNKADKCSRSEVRKTEMQVERAMDEYNLELSIQSFSVLKKNGIEELVELLDDWFDLD